MGDKMKPMTVWQRILITIVTLSAILISVTLSWQFTKMVRGRNYSDVGVVMYENRLMALVVGIFGFPTLSGASIMLIKKTLSRNSRLPYWIGGIVFIICLPFYLLLLLWSYG